MKIGVISDVHGNYRGLLKAINFLESSNCRIFCLGDVISEDGNNNNSCIQLLNAKNIKTVLGQHDNTCLKTGIPPMEDASLEYIESMKTVEMLGNILFVHDNPLDKARNGEGMWKHGSYIFTLLEAQVVLDSFDFKGTGIRYLFFGHSHVPKVFRDGVDESFEFGKPLKLDQNFRYLFNPGRIGGVARSYPEPPPSFLIFDTDNVTVTFYSINQLVQPPEVISTKREYEPYHVKHEAPYSQRNNFKTDKKQSGNMKNVLIGGILGDIAGSIYEGNPIYSKMFPLFGQKSDYTDDTVLMMAVAFSLITGVDYALSYKYFGRNYVVGFGSQFYKWAHSGTLEPFNSNGNGSAMRVLPVAYAMDSVEKVLMEARKSAEVTHNHPEGIKGAQATALAIFFARRGSNKDDIKREITVRFQYNLDRSLDNIRPYYYYKAQAEYSVPESIIAFLESTSVVDAVRNAVSLGGDSDTMACIAGSIAQAYYRDIPDDVVDDVKRRLPNEFLVILDIFDRKFCQNQDDCGIERLHELKEKITGVLQNEQDQQPLKEFEINWDEPLLTLPLVRNDIEFDIEKYREQV